MPNVTATMDAALIDRVVAAVHKAAKRPTRRDAHLQPIRDHVSASIAALAKQVVAGSLPATAFATTASGVLRDAYAQSYQAGSEHAADDFPDAEASDDWDDESVARSQQQVPYLAGFGAALAGFAAYMAATGGTPDKPEKPSAPDVTPVLGPAPPEGDLPSIGPPMTMAELEDRAALYGEGVTGAYEQAYVETGAAAMDNPVMVWHAQGDQDTCLNCLDLDDNEFTEADLPGWPGDNGFDDPVTCLAGPRCRCWLELKDDTGTLAESDQPSGAREAQDAIDAMQPAAKSANKDFAVGSPSGVHMVPFDLAGPGKLRKPKKPKRSKAATLSKEQAGYVDPAPMKARRCEKCSMLRLNPPDFESAGCTLVEGLIAPGATCAHWEKAKGTGKAAPANAVTAEPIAAGIALRALDTGRVLVQQRRADPDDPNGGLLEFGGGHLEDETPWAGALREWQEESACDWPASARVLNTVPSPDGAYVLFIAEVPSEADVAINQRFGVGDGDGLTNPDDPDGSDPEVNLWVDPNTIPGNPAFRYEVATMDHRVLLAPGPVGEIPQPAGDAK